MYQLWAILIDRLHYSGLGDVINLLIKKEMPSFLLFAGSLLATACRHRYEGCARQQREIDKREE
jgi:hypothetical protein